MMAPREDSNRGIMTLDARTTASVACDRLREGLMGGANSGVLRDRVHDLVEALVAVDPMLSIAARMSQGMVVDWDVLGDVIASAVPSIFTNEAAEKIASDALDEAVRMGMIVLQGSDMTPRVVP